MFCNQGRDRMCLNSIAINYLSIHKAQRYGERGLRDVVSGCDPRHVWSIFARRVRKPEATVLIVHPAKKSPKIYKDIVIQIYNNHSVILI